MSDSSLSPSQGLRDTLGLHVWFNEFLRLLLWDPSAIKKWILGSWAMIQCLQYLLLLQRIWVWFPEPIWCSQLSVTQAQGIHHPLLTSTGTKYTHSTQISIQKKTLICMKLIFKILKDFNLCFHSLILTFFLLNFTCDLLCYCHLSFLAIFF